MYLNCHENSFLHQLESFQRFSCTTIKSSKATYGYPFMGITVRTLAIIFKIRFTMLNGLSSTLPNPECGHPEQSDKVKQTDAVRYQMFT